MYEELIDKYGGSASLLNGLAATKIQLGNYEEAEGNLQEVRAVVTVLLLPLYFLLCHLHYCNSYDGSLTSLMLS